MISYNLFPACIWRADPLVQGRQCESDDHPESAISRTFSSGSKQFNHRPLHTNNHASAHKTRGVRGRNTGFCAAFRYSARFCHANSGYVTLACSERPDCRKIDGAPVPQQFKPKVERSRSRTGRKMFLTHLAKSADWASRQKSAVPCASVYGSYAGARAITTRSRPSISGRTVTSVSPAARKMATTAAPCVGPTSTIRRPAGDKCASAPCAIWR